MFTPKTNMQGLSLDNNRVAMGSVAEFTEVYSDDTLPRNLCVGMIGEDILTGMKAILCLNGDTALVHERVAEVDYIGIVQQNLGQNYPAGAQTLSIDTTLDADGLPENSLYGGTLWVYGGTGIGSDGASLRFPIIGNDAGDGTGPIDVELGLPLPTNLGSSTDIVLFSSTYRRLREGTTTSGDIAVGVNLANVPANYMFWAVYEGDVPGTSAASAGEAVEKAANGGFATATAGGRILGYQKYSGNQDIIHMFNAGIANQGSF